MGRSDQSGWAGKDMSAFERAFRHDECDGAESTACSPNLGHLVPRPFEGVDRMKRDCEVGEG